MVIRPGPASRKPLWATDLWRVQLPKILEGRTGGISYILYPPIHPSHYLSRKSENLFVILIGECISTTQDGIPA
jgi:hypothetical protein